jgi:hypothetical protein
MNVYVKAAIDTILFVIYILAIYFGVTYLLDTYDILGLYTLTGLVVAVALYVVYTVSLARRKYQETKAAK